MNSLPKRQVANTETLPMADLGQSSHLDKELVTKIAENLKASVCLCLERFLMNVVIMMKKILL